MRRSKISRATPASSKAESTGRPPARADRPSIENETGLRDADRRVAAAQLARAPAISSSAAGLGTGTSSHALPFCDHWLTRGDPAADAQFSPNPNRMRWWSRRPDLNVDRIELPQTGEREAFRCCFHPALRSIAEWESVPPGSSPNLLPALGFAVVPTSAASNPIVRRLGSTEVWRNRSGGDDQMTQAEPTALVNELAEGAVLPAGESWPDLLLVFHEPQCEVGLEYGFDGELEPIDGPEAVQLLVYDDDGAILGGGPVQPFLHERDSHVLEPGRLLYLIGFRSFAGRIRSVRLRFLRAVPIGMGRADPRNEEPTSSPPGTPFRRPQIVHRVWHEPFPPVAVFEGTARMRWEGHSESLTPVSTTMPFRCDEVAGFLRGFRYRFLDGETHPASNPHVELNVLRNGTSLRVEGKGGFGSDRDYEIDVHFTLVAWERSRVQLTSTPYAGGALREPEADTTTHPVLHHVRAPNPGDSRPAPVFAAPSRLEASTGEVDDIELFAMFTANAGKRTDPPRLDLPIGLSFAPIEHDHFTWNVRGQFLAGPSLQLANGPWFAAYELENWPAWAETAAWTILFPPAGIIDVLFPDGDPAAWVAPNDPDPPPIQGSDDRTALASLAENASGLRNVAVVTTGPRLPGTWLASAPVVDELNLEIPIAADMAFVGLKGFSFKIGDEISEIEAEVSIAHFDGARIVWQVAAGASTKDRPEHPEDADLHQGLATAAAPQFGAISARARGGLDRIVAQPATFRAWPGTVVCEAERLGALINAGDNPVIITRCIYSGPGSELFEPLFRLGRAPDPQWGWTTAEAFGPSSFYSQAPLVLLPGDALMVGGCAMPSATGWTRLPIVFETNSARQPSVQLLLQNFPSRQPPEAMFEPERLEFADLPPKRTAETKVLMRSIGSAPLMVLGAVIAEAKSPFSVAIDPERSTRARRRPSTAMAPLWQVDPGGALCFAVRFAPTKLGKFKHRLLAETNVGTVAAVVAGECKGL